MAIQTEPTRIQIPFADSGTKNVIPDTNSTPSASQAASWTDGFPAQCSLPLSAGGIPPARADFNGILNAMTQSERFTQEGGVWAWDATVDYDTNRVALGSDGLLYWSIAQSGPNVGGAQDPTVDNGIYWTKIPTDDADVLHKSGSETVSGTKTFAESPAIKNIAPTLYLEDTNFTLPGTGGAGAIPFSNSQHETVSEIQFEGLSYATVLRLRVFSPGSISDSADVVCRMDGADGSRYFFPDAASINTMNLGSAAHRWKQLFATTATISTSDARKKTAPEAIPDDVLDAWGAVDFVQFKMLDAVKEKGTDKARLHSGLIAQRIDEAFKAHGLDASCYGLFCHDEWGAEPDSGIEAGDLFSLRYEEALCMEAAYQRRRADRAEARLAALEERLAAIEAKLNS